MIERQFSDFMNELISNRIHWMRCVGCIAVIALHSAIIDNLVKPSWWSSNVYGGITRFAVPIFFMISGCLLINKSYNFDGFIKRRLMRVLPAIVFWNIIYYLWKTHGRGSFFDFLITSLMGPQYYHLWYMYALFGTYLALVVIIPFYNNSGEKEKFFFVGLWAICYGVAPIVLSLLKIASPVIETYGLSLFAEPVGWLVLGAVIRDAVLSKKCRPNAYIAFIASLSCLIAILFLTELYTYRTADMLPPNFVTEIFRTPQSIFTIAYAVCVFLFFLGFKMEVHHRIEKLIGIVSECSLGIYCAHALVMTEVLGRLKYVKVSSWLIIPSVTVLTFLICLGIVYPARKIRLTRYVL